MMSAKLLHLLKDENNSDLGKQIGCMTGLFQLFGSHQFLNGKRLRKISSGNCHSLIIEPNNNLCNQQNSMGNKLNDGADEEQIISLEQSPFSFTSSSCSSSSPFDCRMMSLPEPSFEHLNFLETSSKNSSLAEWSCSSQSDSHSLESTWEPQNHIMNQIYSARTKFNELPAYSKEFKDSPRPFLKGGSLNDICPFSCDGREINDDPFKSSSRIKEQHPRLSLDSNKSKSKSLLRNSQRKTPGVVAKLMGLDTLPTPPLNRELQTGSMKTDRDKNCDDYSSSAPLRENKDPIRFPNYLKNSWKDPDFVRKPIPNARIAIEPAPWMHEDFCGESAKPQFRNLKASLRSASLFPTFYDEIEKRLKDIEYQQSGEDVKTLMQILEVMNQKLLHDTTEEEEEYSKIDLSPNDDQRFRGQHMLKNDHIIGSTIRGVDFAPESPPIVIMKPAKTIKNAGVSSSSMNMVDGLRDSHTIQDCELSHKRNGFINSHTRKAESRYVTHKEPTVNLCRKKLNSKNSRLKQEPRKNELHKGNQKGLIRKEEESVCPRMCRKKLELDTQTRPSNNFSDSSKLRRQPNKKAAESLLSAEKISSESHKLHKKSNHQLSELICESRDDCSAPSDSMENFVDSKIEETGSGNWNPSAALNGPCSQMPSGNGSLNGLEHPSPVSVLDSLEDIVDTPSPVKPDSFKGKSTADRFCKMEISSDRGSGYNSEISREKLQNVDNLVQKLKKLNSCHDEGSSSNTDHIASICENHTNPDHRYISQILLASGLLLSDAGSDPEADAFHSSGHPINPDLFYVLEQRKCDKIDNAKLHRKLIFDTVNEILVWKLRTKRRAQKLVEEVCFEMEEVQRRTGADEAVLDDGLKRKLWAEFGCEIGEIVLCVERLVFKDLVDEILSGEGCMVHRRRHRRQLMFER